MGRDSRHTPELAQEICERLAHGESLRAICAEERMPAHSTVIGWVLDDREGFSDQYARAREAQAYGWADEIVVIADDGSNDWQETEKGPMLNHEHVSRSKLRVDTRKWLLSKLLPKQFGDGDDDGPKQPIQVVIKKPGGRASE